MQEITLTTDQLNLIDRLLVKMRSSWEGKDLVGNSTIDHSIRVANSMASDNQPFEYQLAGLLHDVYEDSKLTREDLEAEAVPEEVLIAVDYLTHHSGDRVHYIKMLRCNTIARMVKMYDLRDNMNLLRLKKFTPGTYRRFMRYAKEYYFLADMNKSEVD